jgi:hypothetical protein
MAMFALAIGNFLTLSRACQQERNRDGRVATSEEALRRGEGEVLRVESLTVQYGALVALSDVSWSVHAGEILGIIGRMERAKVAALPRSRMRSHIPVGPFSTITMFRKPEHMTSRATAFDGPFSTIRFSAN